MSCTYKPHNPVSDGPADLYHRMNQIDCAMKKFGGSVKRKAKPRLRSKTRTRTRSKPKPRKSKRRPK